MRGEDEPEEVSVLMPCEIRVEGERQRSCQRLVDAGEDVEVVGPLNVQLVILKAALLSLARLSKEWDVEGCVGVVHFLRSHSGFDSDSPH